MFMQIDTIQGLGVLIFKCDFIDYSLHTYKLLTGLWMGRDARATGCAEEGHHEMCSAELVCSPVAQSLGPATTPLSPLSEDSLSVKQPPHTRIRTHTEKEKYKSKCLTTERGETDRAMGDW